MWREAPRPIHFPVPMLCFRDSIWRWIFVSNTCTPKAYHHLCNTDHSSSHSNNSVRQACRIVAKIEGAMGSTTRNRIRNSSAPSMRAASITASGIFAVKYVRIIITLKAPMSRSGTRSARIGIPLNMKGTRPHDIGRYQTAENSMVKNRKKAKITPPAVLSWKADRHKKNCNNQIAQRTYCR